MTRRDPAPTEVSHRELYAGSIGRFGLHEVALGSDVRVTLALLRHPGAAAVLPFVGPDRILLIRQYRFAAKEVIWEVPAGKLDPGEAPAACAARELEEETGFRPGRIEVLGRLLTTPGFTDECIHLFSAHDLVAGRTAREPAELIEVHEIPLARAFEMVERGEIIDGKTIAALFHASRR
jgi:ADP-ribose pyrophosphatase